MIIKEFLKDESANTSIEYALIACLIALAVIPTLLFTGHKLAKVFKELAKLMNKTIKRSRR